jgi:subtilisin family serine protease/subtilisin-like proprotein convertase family protein
MRKFWRRDVKKTAQTSRQTGTRRSPVRSLHLEQLEDRLTPSSVLPSLQPPVLELLPSYAPDRVNVVMKSPVGSTAAAQVLASSPYAQSVEYLGLGIYSVHLKPGTSPITAVAYYSTRPYAVTASVDNYVSIQRTPDDPNYPSQWDMPKIGAPTAWDVTTGTRKFVVGVVDSGIDYNHQDLFMNIWINNAEIPTSIRNTLVDADGDGVITFWDLNHSSNAGKVADNNGNGVIDPSDILRPTSQGGWLDGVDQDSNGYVDDLLGWDFANSDNDPMDDNNHGTHVAGTIGAVGNNGVGVAGINWSISLMPLKFLSASGSGLVSRAVMAIDYAVNKGVKLTNHSWGGANYSVSLAAAIGRARDAGHIIVAAAGNSGQNLDSSPQYPASYSTSYNNVVTVASVNSSDQLASSSNYGVNTVTLAAPGVSILSTVRNNGYSYFSGTSMAAPHVAGAIALYWASHPTLSYTQVIEKLKTSVDPIPGLADKVMTGGRLNVGKMFDSTTPSGPRVIEAQWYGEAPFTLDRLRVTFDKAIDVSTFTSEDIVSFTGPNGGISTSYTITSVSGTGNKVFDIRFGVQSSPGTYRLTLGPSILDSDGNAMNQNGNGVNGEDPGDRYTAETVLGSSGPRVVEAQFKGSRPRTFDSVRFTFSKPINPSSFTEDDIIELTGPDGPISTNFTIHSVDGSNNTQFDVIFSQQAKRGNYKIVIGPFIEDSSGNPMNQNGDSINGQIPEDRYSIEQYLDTSVKRRYDVMNVNKPIRDYRITRSVLTVTEAITISDISVRVNLKHTATGDLYIRLIGPQNQAVVLFNRHGRKGDDLRNTWFSDNASTSISQGRPPYNGVFRPVQSFTIFHDILAAGRWTLEVRDTKAGNVGKLLSWSLVITGTMEDGEGGGLGGMMSIQDETASYWPAWYLPPTSTSKDRAGAWEAADPIEVG